MKNINHRLILFSGSLLLLSFFGFKPEPKKKVNKDELLFSFVVTGCNRVDKKDLAKVGPSTANEAQLLRTFSDVAAIKPLPAYLFFAGDLIYGYNADSNAIAIQLNAWKKLYEESPLAKTKLKLVVIPGNHEVMPGKNKPATEALERTWVRCMQPYIAGDNGPKAGGLDSLGSDQSKLTYSINYKNTHFILANSDPAGRDWHVPNHWIENDLKKADAMEHKFIITHKPAHPYPGEDGLNNFPEERDALWSSLNGHHANAMVSAHNHIYYATQPGSKGTWQIVSGNGGSPLHEKGTNFGFVLISVYKSGKVVSEHYARNLPASGYLGDPSTEKTEIKEIIELK